MPTPTLAGVLDLLAGTVLPRVLKIAVFIALGVTLADLLVAFGLIERIASVGRYLTGPANLPEEVGSAILTTTASTTAGYGMLAEFRENGTLDDRATLVAVTVNTFFGFAQHIFTFYAPVLIPILGLRVGLVYVGARALISLAITATGIVAGALLLSEANVDPEAAADAELDRTAETDGGDPAGEDGLAGGGASDGGAGAGDDIPDGREDAGGDAPDGGEDADDDAAPGSVRGKFRSSLASGVDKTRDILPRLVVIYTAVVLLTTYYDITQLTAMADPLVAATGLPAAAVPVIAVYAIDTTNGALVIAPLLGETFTPRQAVATMLVGGIVSFAVSTFKRSIPFQYGIWGPEFGSKVVAVNTALKVVWIGIAVVLLLYAPLPL